MPANRPPSRHPTSSRRTARSAAAAAVAYTSTRSASKTDDGAVDDQVTDRRYQPVSANHAPSVRSSKRASSTERRRNRANAAIHANARTGQPHDDEKKPPFAAATPPTATA